MIRREQKTGACACVLTPDGRGALAVIRVWGTGAIAAVDLAFRHDRDRRLAQTTVGRPRLGRIGQGLGDEVVVSVLPGTYPEAEIHTHGGPAALTLVLDSLVAAGVTITEPSEWLAERHVSPLARQAEIDLAAATTTRAAEILMDQAGGALEREIREIIARIDRDPRVAASEIESLVAQAKVGTRLIKGWRVALAGRPNVGKSRLLNAIAGYDRSIVDPTPGTTRDVVTAITAIEGWPVELADTAGLRETVDAIEAAGVVAARNWHSRSDLIVMVYDRSIPQDFDEAEQPGSLRVANKSDLPAAWDEASIGALAVSATTGSGLSALIEAIGARLVPDPPRPGAAVPFRAEHLGPLRQALVQLEQGNPAGAIAALGGLLKSTSTVPDALH